VTRVRLRKASDQHRQERLPQDGIVYTAPLGGFYLTAFCVNMESGETWLKRKFRLWRTHPWIFVAGFAAGLAVFEAARLIFG
jgi:hypothetical protein